MDALRDQHCEPLAKGTPPLTQAQMEEYLKDIPQWSLADSQTAIQREFHFKNFYETMAFVNTVAWVAHQQDHHPEMAVSYKHCKIIYATHSIGGLSKNDFICAAQIDALLA